METLQRLHNRGSVSTGYNIDNSVKFEDANDEYFTRTNASGTNRRTFTVSLWCKRSFLSTADGLTMELWDGGVHSEATRFGFGLNNDELWYDIGYSARYRGQSTRQFTDTYAWYHIGWKVDTTQATEADRMRWYVNGVEETDWASRQYPPQNFDTAVHAGTLARIGSYDATYHGFRGYIAEFNYLDGLAVDCTEFGEFDEDSNIWKPKAYTGSYGTNGFFLDFADASDLGDDESGNGNDFTETNITAADQATDTPTNNFPILVPMYITTANSTLSEGGLKWDINMPSGSAFNPNTSAMSSFQVSGTNGGKWYIESKITNNERGFSGIISSLALLQQTVDPTEFVYWDYYNGWIGSSLISTETNPPGVAVNDIVGIALDCDNQRVTFSKNGGWLVANGDMTGTSPSDWRWDWTSDANFLDHPNCNGNIAFWCGIQTDSNTFRPIHLVNFGGYSPYTISSGNSDENGYGNFEYAVPSGFYALCTKNLAEYG